MKNIGQSIARKAAAARTKAKPVSFGKVMRRKAMGVKSRGGSVSSGERVHVGGPAFSGQF